MKTIIMTLFLLLVVGNGVAADKQPDKDSSAKSPGTNEAQKGSGQKTVEKKGTVQWPRPYKSTEEVSADSMVPFPTDI